MTAVDVRAELSDPATLVVAGILGGLGGAVVAARTAPAGGLVAGLALAALVLGAKVAAVAALAPPEGDRGDPAPAGPVGATADAVDWLRRATDAVATIRRRAVLVTDPLLVDAADDLVGVAARVLDAIYRHAGLVARTAGTPTAEAVARAALAGMEVGVPALADVAARLSGPAPPPPSLVTLIDDLRIVGDHLARTEVEARRARTTG